MKNTSHLVALQFLRIFELWTSSYAVSVCQSLHNCSHSLLQCVYKHNVNIIARTK